MNFNANSGPRQPFGRKIKRVSDVNAMGFNPYGSQQNSFTNGPDTNPNFQQDFNNQNMTMNNSGYSNQMKNIPYMDTNKQYNNFQQQQQQQQQDQVPDSMPNQMSMFAQPVVQDMALQYGAQLADKGKSLVKNEFERYVPVTKLKYYFAVDTKYVISKLGLLLFPFTHADWSVKYEQDGPVQPRFEINAPDLYIPTMAYVTYVLVAGFVLGMQQRFSPEQISIQASSSLAWCIIEILLYHCILYIANIETSLKSLDLLAYGGYKFIAIIASILISLVGNNTGYYATLVYTNFALAFFLVRTLRVKVLPETTQQTSYYGEMPAYGNKRRLYFLVFVAIVQPILSWWLSFHLCGYVAPKPKTA